MVTSFIVLGRGRNDEIVRGELSSTVKGQSLPCSCRRDFRGSDAPQKSQRGGGMRGDSAGVFGVAPVLRFSALHQARKLRSLSLQPTDRQTGPLRFPRWGLRLMPQRTRLYLKGKRFQSWLRFRVHGN